MSNQQHIDNFDPFTFDDEGGIQEEKADKAFGDGFNPWPDSSNPWDQQTSFEASFFPFSAEKASLKDETITNQRQQEAEELFPSDPMADVSGDDLVVGSCNQNNAAANNGCGEDMPTTSIRIAIREQFTSIYDDEGSNGSSLGGTMQIQPSTQNQPKTPLDLSIKDELQIMASLTLMPQTAEFSEDDSREEGHRILRVKLPESSKHHDDATVVTPVPIATYTCNTQKMRPIPMVCAVCCLCELFHRMRFFSLLIPFTAYFLYTHYLSIIS